MSGMGEALETRKHRPSLAEGGAGEPFGLSASNTLLQTGSPPECDSRAVVLEGLGLDACDGVALQQRRERGRRQLAQPVQRGRAAQRVLVQLLQRAAVHLEPAQRGLSQRRRRPGQRVAAQVELLQARAALQRPRGDGAQRVRRQRRQRPRAHLRQPAAAQRQAPQPAQPAEGARLACAERGTRKRAVYLPCRGGEKGRRMSATI
ncbi:Protein of unknown function [Gryllus bimaculatus]|nr:Protein of unknown function [Gryllus bimaculatus]